MPAPSHSRLRTRWMGAKDPYRALPFTNKARGLERERPIAVPRKQAFDWHRVWNKMRISVELSIDPSLSLTGAGSYSNNWEIQRGNGLLTERDILRPGLNDDVVHPRAVPTCFDWSGTKSVNEPIDETPVDDVWPLGFTASASLELFADGYTIPSSGLVAAGYVKPSIKFSLTWVPNSGDGFVIESLPFNGVTEGEPENGEFDAQLDGLQLPCRWGTSSGASTEGLFLADPNVTLTFTEAFGFAGARASDGSLLVVDLGADRHV